MGTNNIKKSMKRGVEYRIVCEKIFDNHKLHCTDPNCTSEVINMIDGKLVYSRILFKCGESIKINCRCLEEIKNN
jgi:hypothetical protein